MSKSKKGFDEENNSFSLLKATKKSSELLSDELLSNKQNES